MNTNDTKLTQEGHNLVDASADKAHQAVSKAADKADQAIASSTSNLAAAEKSVSEGIHQIREAVPATLYRAAREAEDMAHAGIDKARIAGESMTQQANELRDKTVDYTREEPIRALLMAATAGAFATLLIGWASRNNGYPRH